MLEKVLDQPKQDHQIPPYFDGNGEVDQGVWTKYYLNPILSQLKRSCEILTKSNDQAEELLQNVLFKAWKSRKTYDPSKAKFVTWMQVVLESQYAESFRGKKQVKQVSLYGYIYDKKDGTFKRRDEVIPDETQRGGGDFYTLQKEFADKLDDSLLGLGEKYQKPLSLVFQGFSYEDIQKKLNLNSLGTVKGQIWRGRDLLKKSLEKKDVDHTFFN